jgi:hypothetical protein
MLTHLFDASPTACCCSCFRAGWRWEGPCRSRALLAGLVYNPPHRLFASRTTSRMSTIAFIGFPKTCFCASSAKG